MSIAIQGVFDEATELAHVRSRAGIAKLVAGMEIIDLGLAWPPWWRPDPGDEVPANAAESYYCVPGWRSSADSCRKRLRSGSTNHHRANQANIPAAKTMAG